ncbi:MAG: type III-A CRISPR-associated RAMP protein Csm3 [Clostridia bacterium]|nr:type III-A CRISPR-associated RAMP protein Csm3 [Clostridia bacterium]
MISTIKGKIMITGKLTLRTGMHIGASSDFSAIGAVDSVIVRDMLTQRPYLPGSSLKGKMRYLLARTTVDNGQLKPIDQEPDVLKRLFGNSKDEIVQSRLQFYDLFMNEESIKKINNLETDLYLSEIKFENTINRATAVANPRQIERVPAGSCFDFKLNYNVEDVDTVEEDFKNIALAVNLLEDDYLGGHGTRGYGRVAFSQFEFKERYYVQDNKEVMKECSDKAKAAFKKQRDQGELSGRGVI